MNRRELLHRLRACGAVMVRHGASHDIWRGPNGEERPVPRHTYINRFTARGILKALGCE